MTSQRHNEGIAAILARHSDARTTGFGAACNAIIAASPDARFRLAMIPDAFRVDSAEQLVTAFEVEETCPVSAEKMTLYSDLWWGLDGAGWRLALVRITRDGDEKVIDMGEHTIGRLVEDARPGAFA